MSVAKSNKIIFSFAFLIFFFCGMFFSCVSSPKDEKEKKEQEQISLSLLFAGDIMAHKSNFLMKDFSLIYKDIETDLKEADLAFCNIEAPVADTLDFQTYPTFNMKNEYVKKAIEAGFCVFSLANNHTNDQGLLGITSTSNFFSSLPNIYYSGLKTKDKAKIIPVLIQKKGFKVLFVAVTELLNSLSCQNMINYIGTDEVSRKVFIEDLAKMKEEYVADFFVLSFHTAEPEYVAEVSKRQKEFYEKILQSGVDIVWANHPHVTREWEIILDDMGVQRKLIMYGNGNTISAQRTSPDFDDATKNRADTGDAVMISVVAKKNMKTGISFETKEPIYITTYIDRQKNFVIRKMNEKTMQDLKAQGQDKWATYIQKRLEITSKIRGNIIWQ